MAIEIATAYVSIVPSTNKIAPAVKQALKDIQDDADRNPINVKTKADTRSISQVSKAVADLGRAAGGTAAVGAGIAAIGGAAGIAAGAVGALSVGLAAIGGAAGAGIATVAVGVHGVADAFKAAIAAQDSFADDAQAKAKAVQSAQEGVVSAQRAVAQAQRGVTSALQDQQRAERDIQDAKRESKRAEEDLTEARKDATRSLEDLNRQLQKGKLDEEGAAIAVAEAQRDLIKTLADPNADAIDRAAAQHRLNEALSDQQDVLVKVRRTQEDANEANAKGVEGSDKVVSAKDRVTQANERVQDSEQAAQKAQQNVADAQEKVADANQKLADANQKLSDAQNQTSATAKKAQEALAKLSPNARDFVTQMLALGPAMSSFKNSVQDQLFAGLGASFTTLAQSTLPTVQAGMDGVAGAINGAAKAAAEFFSTTQAQQGIQAAFAGTRDIIDSSVGGIETLTAGILNMAEAAQPAMANIGLALGSVFAAVGNTLTQLRDSGALTALFQNFAGILRSMAPLLGGLVNALVTLGNTAAPGITALFSALGPALQTIAGPLGQLGASLGQGFAAIMPTLAQLISALANGLRPVLPILAQLLNALGQALLPLVGPLSQITAVVGSALTQAIKALAPAVGPLGTLFASLVSAVAPLLPLAAQLVTDLVQALAPALTTVVNALAPVIQQFATAFAPVLKEIAPVLAQVASQTANVLAQALTTLAPIIPDIVNAFLGLVQALLPLLPSLEQIGVALLPPLAQLLVAILPSVVGLVNIFTKLVSDVLVPLLQPALHLAAAEARLLGDAVLWLWQNVIEPAFKGIGIAIKTVWDATVKPAFDLFTAAIRDVLGPAISFFWRNVIEPAWHGIGDVISAVWNATIAPAWDNMKKALGALGDFFDTVHDVVSGAWTKLGDGIKTVIDKVVKPAFDGIKTALDSVKDAFKAAVSFIGQVWDGIKHVMADPINWVIDKVINHGIFGAWNKVAGFLHLPTLTDIEPIRFATGGYVSGAGGPKDDLIPAMLSNGEYVLNAATVARIGVENLNHINGGGTADGLASLVPKFQAGGEVTAALVNAHDFARSMNGQAYLMGGTPPGPTDCSGYMAAIANVALGGNGRGRWWSTTAFPASQVGSVNAGGQPWSGGLGYGFSIGVKGGADSGGANGHTAGTLSAAGKYPTINVESGGSHGNVAYGGAAIGADGGFPTMYHLAIADGKFESGGKGGIFGWIRDKVGKLFEIPVRALEKIIPTFPGPYGAVPKALYKKIADSAIDFIRGKSDDEDAKTGAGAPGTGPVRDQVQQAFARYGWGDGAEWAAASWIISHESGWNPTAVNPKSGAYGLAQFLGSTKDQYLPDSNPNPGVQGDAMARYIRDRYGDPIKAQQFWMEHNWYDSGGIFPNNSIGINQSGKPEAVLTNDQWKLFTKFVELLGQGKLSDAVNAIIAQRGAPVTPIVILNGSTQGTATTPGTTTPTITPAVTANPLSAESIGTRLAGIGTNFLQANIDQFKQDIGAPSGGGAVEALVGVIQQSMAQQIAQLLAQQKQQSASFVGRR